MANQILMTFIAAGAVLGGLDWILGGRLGLGAQWQKGLELMGPIALSMAGLLCLTPLMAQFLRWSLVPLLSPLGLDPGICGGILAVDAGGYPLARELAQDPSVGAYAGTIVAATFGCTITFVIPVGMGTLSGTQREELALGVTIGLIFLPVVLMTGGLMGGLPLGKLLFQSVPVFLVCLVLLVATVKWPGGVVKQFLRFARCIQILGAIGLILGAVKHLTGWPLLESMTPLKDAMTTVGEISIVLLGSLPLARCLETLLARPLGALGRRAGLESSGTTALLLGFVLAMPALTMLKDMDRRGRVVNGAFLVCGASALSAHLGYVLGACPDWAVPMLVAKLVGGAVAAVAAVVVANHFPK